MYEAHFGLRQRPFRPTPDRDAYYPATAHEQALAPLRQAVADGEGFALLTGEPGTGKTLVCHCLLEKETGATAFLTNSHFPDRAGLLQAILFDLGLPHDCGGEQAMRLALTDFLLKNLAQGNRTLLVIDEAQHLASGMLEELRLLGNIESGNRKAIQVVLAALPGFEKHLNAPALAAFRQRLVVRCRLDPLGRHESVDYLVHQVRRAGGRPERIFNDEALDILARASGGVPRLLNQTGHQSLVLAFQAGLKMVDAEVAFEACSLLHLTVEDAPEESELAVMPETDTDSMADEEDDRASGFFTSSRPA